MKRKIKKLDLSSLLYRIENLEMEAKYQRLDAHEIVTSEVNRQINAILNIDFKKAMDTPQRINILEGIMKGIINSLPDLKKKYGRELQKGATKSASKV